MIEYKDKTYRNLQEQVLKNKEDIAELREIDIFLNGLGIEVQGVLESEEQLPGADVMGENYGYAYLVGTEAPYYIYVWSRPNINAGHSYPYWINLGDMAVVGPQGPKGDTGETGPRGTRGSVIVTYDRAPTGSDLSIEILGTPIVFQKEDIWINTTNGDLYQVQAVNPGSYILWVNRANIKGPQGIQGIQGIQGEQGPKGDPGAKGDTGDVGGFINIAGILSSSSSLPDPETIGNLTVAYLVGSTTPYDLYIQVGSTSATAVWENMGALNVATYVTVNGNYQNTWNADVKVDKLTAATGKYAYTRIGGYEGGTQMTTAADPYSIVERDSQGISHVANAHMNLNDSQYDTEIINKSVLKAALDGYVKINPDSGFSEMAYGRNTQGETAFRISQTNNISTIVKREGQGSGGTIRIGTPTISSTNADRAVTVTNIINTTRYQHRLGIHYGIIIGQDTYEFTLYMTGYSNDSTSCALAYDTPSADALPVVNRFVATFPYATNGSIIINNVAYDIISSLFNVSTTHWLITYYDHVNSVVKVQPLSFWGQDLCKFSISDVVSPTYS